MNGVHSGEYAINLYTVIKTIVRQASVFVFCFSIINIFVQGWEPTRGELSMRLHYKCKLLAQLTNIRLGWKKITVTKDLAYLSRLIITMVKRCIEYIPGFIAKE